MKKLFVAFSILVCLCLMLFGFWWYWIQPLSVKSALMQSYLNKNQSLMMEDIGNIGSKVDKGAVNSFQFTFHPLYLSNVIALAEKSGLKVQAANTISGDHLEFQKRKYLDVQFFQLSVFASNNAQDSDSDSVSVFLDKLMALKAFIKIIQISVGKNVSELTIANVTKIHWQWVPRLAKMPEVPRATFTHINNIIHKVRYRLKGIIHTGIVSEIWIKPEPGQMKMLKVGDDIFLHQKNMKIMNIQENQVSLKGVEGLYIWKLNETIQ